MSDTLKQNENLLSGSSLVSNNGYYQAVMQADGNFCVYQKTDSGNNPLWCCGPGQSQGNYFVAMQADGNLCVYAGTPGNITSTVWCRTDTGLPAGNYFLVMQDDGNLCVYNTVNNKSVWVWDFQSYDPIVDVTNLSNMVYDLANPTVVNQMLNSLNSITIVNGTSITQHESRQMTTSVTESTSWSNTVGVTVSVTTSFNVGIPIIADGKVEVSASASNSYTWGKQTDKTVTDAFTADVDVPANTTVVAVIAAVSSTITVPYTVQGTIVYKSGRTFSTTIAGTYSGVSAHDYVVTYKTKTGQPIQGFLSYQNQAGETVQTAAKSAVLSS